METLILLLSGGIFFYALISRRAERSPLTPPLFFLAAGCLFGPGVLQWFELDIARTAVHGLGEFALVLVLFTDASRIDLSCLRREENVPIRLLGIGLPLCIVLGALGALWLLPSLALPEALLLAAILAPTDAALGQAVVSSPLLPVRIRQSLNVESGLNDGIALPLVLMFASLAESVGGVGGGHWLQFALLQVTLGPLAGVAVGVAGGRLVDRAVEAGWINEAFEHLAVLGLAGLAFAGAEAIGGNGFIAAFVAGLALGNTARGTCERLHAFGEAEGQLLTLLVFGVFGALYVPAAFEQADARALLYVIGSLTVFRMLPVALSLFGLGLRIPTLLFLGWFGPRGLASIVFTLMVVEESVFPSSERVQVIVVLTVFFSALLHGVTAYPLARRYGEWLERRCESDEPELTTVPEMPVRLRHADG